MYNSRVLAGNRWVTQIRIIRGEFVCKGVFTEVGVRGKHRDGAGTLG